MRFYCVFIIYKYTDLVFTKTTKRIKIDLSWEELGQNKDAVFTLLENKIKSMYFNNTGPTKHNKHISLQYFFAT